MAGNSLNTCSSSAAGEGLTVAKKGTEVFIPYEKVTALERVRIPGWWPLRADLKPRTQTARAMIRISVKGKPPLTFVSGLEEEEELLEAIRKTAGLSQE